VRKGKWTNIVPPKRKSRSPTITVHWRRRGGGAEEIEIFYFSLTSTLNTLSRWLNFSPVTCLRIKLPKIIEMDILNGVITAEKVNFVLMHPHRMRSTTARALFSFELHKMPLTRFQVQITEFIVIKIVRSMRLTVFIRTTTKDKLKIKYFFERINLKKKLTIRPFQTQAA
jgi:hypothetical protein